MRVQCRVAVARSHALTRHGNELRFIVMLGSEGQHLENVSDSGHDADYYTVNR